MQWRAQIKDPEVRIIIVTGAGGRAFSTGYDQKESAKSEQEKSVEEWRERMDSAYQFTRCVMDCTKPTIAVIDGYCLAGAMELAQMCDIRYCSDDARFGAIEARFSHGLATMIMPWIVGRSLPRADLHRRHVRRPGGAADRTGDTRLSKADLGARDAEDRQAHVARRAVMPAMEQASAQGQHSRSWVSAPLCATASRPPPSWTPKARRNMIGSMKSGGPKA